MDLQYASQFSFLRIGGKDGENGGTGTAFHGGGTGKPAEGRQDGIIRAKIVAGKAKALFAGAADGDPRMNMAGEGIMGFGLYGSGDIMNERECTDPKVFMADSDAGGLVPGLVQNIVIALDQLDLQFGQIVPPFLEQLQFLIFPAVKQVAHDQQLPWLEILDEGEEPLQVFPVNILRHGDARFAEMTCFAK